MCVHHLFFSFFQFLLTCFLFPLGNNVMLLSSVNLSLYAVFAVTRVILSASLSSLSVLSAHDGVFLLLNPLKGGW